MNNIKILHFKKAFSLIELLIVVIILSLVIGLAIPNLSKGRTAVELKQTAKDIAYVMQYAQQRSVIDGKIYQLKFNEEGSRYWLMIEDLSSGENLFEKKFKRFTGRLSKISNISNNISVILPADVVQFYPNGLSDRVEIKVSDGKNTIVVSTEKQRGSVYVFEMEN